MGLSTIYRGSMTELWDFCYSIVSKKTNTEEKVNVLTKKCNLLSLFLSMFESETQSPSDLSSIIKEYINSKKGRSFNFSQNLSESQLLQILEDFHLKAGAPREIPYEIMPIQLIASSQK